jgi:HPt (histidine-containing phosphotransfer) domain-containing protein
MFDRQAVLDRLGGDEQLLGEIAGLFLEDCPRLVQSMREAVAAADAPNLQLAAHTLKGSLSYLGGCRICEAARRLESIGADADLTGAPEALQALADQTDGLLSALTELVAQPAYP